MTANTQAGAASNAPVTWSAIDWRAAHENVRRLQVRIVKATQEKRWGKVKALQHLLTHSFSGRALAVRRVTENQGKRTAGVDQILWDTPAKKARAVGELKTRGYHPLPLRRVNIPKKNGSMRPLSIPCMKDRAMQALHLLALDPIAETTADPNSYGFRPGRAPADAISQCFRIFMLKGTAEWVLEADIKSCFDKISHDWILANIPLNAAILKKWLKAGYTDRGTFYPTEEGTPQGGIISPVIANLTLDGLEGALREVFPKRAKRQGLRQSLCVNFVRFADDFIVSSKSKEMLEKEVRPIVEDFLRRRGLELSPEKTRITHIEKGFDFLGQNIRKYKGTLRIKPAKKSVKALLDKVRGIVKVNRQATTGGLIQLLNPVLRGWTNYHRHVVSNETFSTVDHEVFRILWRWAKRRHPKKRRRWIRRQYFRTVGTNNWVLTGTIIGSKAERRTVHLLCAQGVRTIRHTKIRAEANPYDPAWEVYFEERQGVQMERNLRRRRTLLYLWKEQDGRCPVCRQKITKLTGWHSHHIVWRSHGGSDGAENRVLLHPDCHRKIHSLGLPVVKPRPRKGVRRA